MLYLIKMHWLCKHFKTLSDAVYPTYKPHRENIKKCQITVRRLVGNSQDRFLELPPGSLTTVHTLKPTQTHRLWAPHAQKNICTSGSNTGDTHTHTHTHTHSHPHTLTPTHTYSHTHHPHTGTADTAWSKPTQVVFLVSMIVEPPACIWLCVNRTMHQDVCVCVWQSEYNKHWNQHKHTGYEHIVLHMHKPKTYAHAHISHSTCAFLSPSNTHTHTPSHTHTHSYLAFS